MTDLSIETPSAPIIGKQPRPIYSNSGWSDERVEMLKLLWANGLSASQIAAELGYVTRNAVIGRVHRMGLSGRTKQPHRSSEGGPRRSYRQRAVVPRDAMRVDRMLNAEPEFEPEPEPEVILDEMIPIGQRRTVLELTDQTCKWPIGSPGVDLFFCGASPAAGSVYCTHHHYRAHRDVPQRQTDPQRKAA